MKSKRNPAIIHQLLYSVIAGLLLGISALALYHVQDQLRRASPIQSEAFRVEGKADFDGAIAIAPPITVPDFTLTDQHGEPFNSSQLRNRYALLTFGFTNCPDICPLTLNDFQQVKVMLGALAEQLAFVFVSVDGRRDRPAVLRRFLEFRELDGIIALTGGENNVREIGAPFGLAFEVSGDLANGAYNVNHSAGSYLLDDRGRWIMRFHFGVSAERIAAELRQLLA